MSETVTVTKTSGDWVDQYDKVRSGDFWKIEFDGYRYNRAVSTHTKKWIREWVGGNFGFDTKIVWVTQ